MELLIKKIALLLASLASLIGITSKLGGLPQEMPMYERTVGMECFPAESSEGGAIGCRPKMQVRKLLEGQFYKTGNTDFGSTTPEVKYKKDGVESIKYLNEIP